MNLKEKMQIAYNIKIKNFKEDIEFSYPNQTLAISTTKNSCSLNCAHCNGHYLNNMVPIEDYENKIKNREITSFLISGGCQNDGNVPINKHLNIIKKLKKEGYLLNAHLGLMDEKYIEEISKYLDVVSFDLVFDEETIKEVYKIDKKKDDYINTYEFIKKRVEVAPHICIGLKGGKIKGEYDIINYLKKDPPKKITFIVLIPTKNTEYENVEPPSLKEVADIICEARINLPTTEINLGCMRPRGSYRSELDKMAILCGVNKIVLPSKQAKNKAFDMKLNITEGKECCVL